jgi:hypothetical protein
MHELGYDFAERDTRTDGQGTRIERNVGTHPNGEPKLAYLMETPRRPVRHRRRPRRKSG